MERMMKVMVGRMDKEQKVGMMDKMMEEFFKDFAEMDKRQMMMQMMPKKM